MIGRFDRSFESGEFKADECIGLLYLRWYLFVQNSMFNKYADEVKIIVVVLGILLVFGKGNINFTACEIILTDILGSHVSSHGSIASQISRLQQVSSLSNYIIHYVSN